MSPAQAVLSRPQFLSGRRAYEHFPEPDRRSFLAEFSALWYLGNLDHVNIVGIPGESRQCLFCIRCEPARYIPVSASDQIGAELSSERRSVKLGFIIVVDLSTIVEVVIALTVYNPEHSGGVPT